MLSENWKPSGTGGHSSRGWGTVVHDAGTAAFLAGVFRADAGWRDGIAWRNYSRDAEFQPVDGVATEDYPSRFEPKQLRAKNVEVVVAPDNARRAVLELLRSARETILVQQMAIGSRRSAFLAATLAAARRGVKVRILLSSAWYVRDANARLVEFLNEVANREDLDLEARLASHGRSYGKIHNKGVIVDGERVLVGSLNWNANAFNQNREVAVIVEGEAVAGYYARVFRADWEAGGGHRRVPVGLVLVVVLAAAVVAKWLAETVEFTERVKG